MVSQWLVYMPLDLLAWVACCWKGWVTISAGLLRLAAGLGGMRLFAW
jgi:hypothetical protein